MLRVNKNGRHTFNYTKVIYFTANNTIFLNSKQQITTIKTNNNTYAITLYVRSDNDKIIISKHEYDVYGLDPR